MYLRAPHTGPSSSRLTQRPVSKTRRRRRLKVFDVRASSAELEFVLLDLNTAGVRIETTEPVRTGSTLTFRFERNGATATIEGRVMWCRLHRTLRTGPDESRSFYRAGFSFAAANNASELTSIFA